MWPSRFAFQVHACHAASLNPEAGLFPRTAELPAYVCTGFSFLVVAELQSFDL